MSNKHPIIAITGSSGAGTTTVKNAFNHIFQRLGIKATVIEGDSYHKYDRVAMKDKEKREKEAGNHLFSHFGPDANLFDKLAESFKNYGETGQCMRRYYLHSYEEAKPYGKNPGEFTEWELTDKDSDLLFYEGLHGGIVHGDIDVAKHVDLLIGVVPVVNLEWIQKIHRDQNERGYSEKAIVDTIHRRMWDYINYITPQFSRTDVNFQRVPTVDTSNPFIARDIPTLDESFVVIRCKNPEQDNLLYIKNMIKDSFMSRRNNLVVPGGKMGFAMELIFEGKLKEMLDKK